MKQKPFAEVIESSLEYFVAHCWNADLFPAFGSFVCIPTEKQMIIGCVTQIQTGSSDPSRYPFPYQKTEAELKAEQPQIFAFLKTTIRAQIIGYVDTTTNKIHYLLPSTPSKIHAFVEPSPKLLEQTILEKSSFLHLLFSAAAQIPNLDELLLAILTQLPKNSEKKYQQFLRDFCHKFSMLTGSDYRRLKLFLHRVEELNS